MQELEKILEKIIKKSFCVEIREYESETVVLLDDVEEILEKHMNDGWIPVDKNNVPDHEVLACDKYENELIGYLRYDEDAEEFVCEGEGCVMFHVRSWMEKPEPYRPERSGV